MSIDNSQPGATVISVEGYNRPGLLTALTATFRDLGLDVSKVRNSKSDLSPDRFLLETVCSCAAACAA